MVTFDDGYKSLFDNAWPVLQEHRIPATIFVNTAFLDRDTPFPFDNWGMTHQGLAPTASYCPLTTEQLQEMSASGLIEVAAHTHTHEDFRGRPEAFQADLQRSIDIVRDRFGAKEITFAFPFGYAGSELAEAAKRTEVVCALTTEATTVKPSSDPFQWGRFNVFPWDTSATLAAKVGGWYSWAPRLWRSARAFARRAYR